MVTYGLPVVYALNINLINYGKNRFSLLSRELYLQKKESNIDRFM